MLKPPLPPPPPPPTHPPGDYFVTRFQSSPKHKKPASYAGYVLRSNYDGIRTFCTSMTGFIQRFCVSSLLSFVRKVSRMTRVVMYREVAKKHLGSLRMRTKMCRKSMHVPPDDEREIKLCCQLIRTLPVSCTVFIGAYMFGQLGRGGCCPVYLSSNNVNTSLLEKRVF